MNNKNVKPTAHAQVQATSYAARIAELAKRPDFIGNTGRVIKIGR